MIQLLQAQNFRMLRSNSVALQPYQVLVGQNATGKSTLLGALQLIGDVLRGGVHHAVERVAPSFYDLCFDPSEPFSLAVELTVPDSSPQGHRLRYEIEIGIADELLQVLRENLFLLPSEDLEQSRPENAALGSLPEDPDRFPLAITARNALRNGIRTLQLDAARMRSASSPSRETKIAVDGSNLPHVIRGFMRRDPVLFDQWVQHVAAAVEGLESVDVWERPEDKFLVLRARFQGRHQEPVPSWLLSDGTLRLMALTLVNYAAIEDDLDTYLIEEPENGLHPLEIQVVHEVLSKPPLNVQILCATHSPILLAQTDPEQVLVFRRARGGHAIISRALEIPELKGWAGRVNLSDLFVTGVLG